MTRVGVITGLVSEARCLRDLSHDINLDISASGVSAKRAEALARNMCRNGCKLLVSFGIAGALRPGIRTGDLLIPASVRQEGGKILETDSNVRARLVKMAREALLELTILEDPILATDRLLGGVEEKLSAGRVSGAAAVDMESHKIAIAARAAGMSIIVVRAVWDDAATALPGFVNRAVTPQGKPDFARVLAGAAWRPWELVRLARLSRTAHRTLRRVAPILTRILEG